MFKILDGRTKLYQWDTDVKLQVVDSENFAPCEAHFLADGKGEPLTVLVDRSGEIPTVEIPNILLQKKQYIVVYAYCKKTSAKCTVERNVFEVKERPKPSEYVYTETETKTFDALEKRITELEKGESGSGTPFAVQYIEQKLEDEQKAQARKNIGSASSEDVSKLSEDKVDKPLIAEVGQIIAVKSVDKNGKPTEFEAVDRNVNNTSISLKDVTTNKNYKLEVINGKLTMTEVE